MNIINFLPFLGKTLISAPKICVNFSIGLVVGAIEAVGVKISGKTKIDDSSLVELPEAFDSSVSQEQIDITSQQSDQIQEIIAANPKTLLTTKAKTILTATVMDNRLVIIAAPLLIAGSWALFNIGRSTIEKIRRSTY
jgi:hypothetical protein